MQNKEERGVLERLVSFETEGVDGETGGNRSLKRDAIELAPIILHGRAVGLRSSGCEPYAPSMSPIQKYLSVA